MKRSPLRPEAVPAALVVIAFIAGVIESPHFLDLRYLLDASSLYVEGGLLALGMTLVILLGGIDLSVASSMALVACVSAKLLASGVGTLPTIVLALILGVGLGAFNGILVARFKLPSFVVTLATMAGYRGIAQAMLGAQSVRIPTPLVGLDIAHLPGIPVPIPLLVLLVFAALVGVLLHRTVFGRWVYAVGTQPRAALFSGIPVDRVTILVFALTGFLAAVAGLMINSRLGVARFDDAKGLELDVITAVVLGGTRITGGKGSILGTLLALLLVGLIRTGMGLANVTAEYQLAVVGSLLIIAILFGNVAHRWGSARRPSSPTSQNPSSENIPS